MRAGNPANFCSSVTDVGDVRSFQGARGQLSNQIPRERKQLRDRSRPFAGGSRTHAGVEIAQRDSSITVHFESLNPRSRAFQPRIELFIVLSANGGERVQGSTAQICVGEKARIELFQV